MLSLSEAKQKWAKTNQTKNDKNKIKKPPQNNNSEGYSSNQIIAVRKTCNSTACLHEKI